MARVTTGNVIKVARCKACLGQPTCRNLPVRVEFKVGSAPRTQRASPQAEVETGRIMRTRIPKLIAEINTIIADHSDTDSEEEQEAIELLKRARHKLGLASVKLQEADLKKHRLAAGQ